MKIEFDSATHTYTLDGRRVPSVTQALGMLQDFRFVNPDVLKRAQEFGKAVHKTIELWEAEDLDMGSVDPALMPYLDGYLLWRSHFEPESVESEVLVGSAIHRYAGTADMVVTKAGKRTLLDLKSGQSPTAGPQTAAYQKAWEEMTGQKIHERRCLRLTDKGPRLAMLNDLSDWSLFQSCLNVHNYQEKHRAA